MIIETDNYKFFLLEEDDITFGQKRQIQKVLLKDSKLNDKDVDFNFGSLFDVQDELLKVILVKIEEKKSGKEIKEDCFNFVQNLKTDDPQILYEKINGIFQNFNKPHKKKA